MADTPQTAALIVVAQNFAGDIVRQINRTSTALRLLPMVRGEGKNIAWVAESSGAIAEYHTDGQDAANFGSDAQADAILVWQQARANAHITGLARATARTSQTPRGNIALIARNISNSAAALASFVNGDIFTGSGSAQITGFDEAIGDVGNIYATIDRSSAVYWRPYLVDPGSLTALSFGQIRTDLAAIKILSGERPDLGLVSPDVYNAISGLFDSNRQFMQRTDEITTARGKTNLVNDTSSPPGIRIDGCTFVEDKDAAANTIYYVNTNHTHIELLMPSDEMAAGIEPGMMFTANDGFGPVPLAFEFQKLAKTGDADKYQILTKLDLVVKKPNSCGVRLNVQV